MGRLNTCSKKGVKVHVKKTMTPVGKTKLGVLTKRKEKGNELGHVMHEVRERGNKKKAKVAEQGISNVDSE